MRYKLLEDYYNGPEYLKKLQARANNMKLLAEDPLQRARLILDVYSVDPIAFIEDFGWVKIPEFNNALKPLFLFDYQKNIINKLIESERSNLDHEILVDKPRGMGLTWIVLWYMYWRWLFTPNWTGFLLSRTEDEVDDGGNLPDSSLFGKLRWMISKTPRFLISDAFVPKGKKGTNTDMSLRLVNPSMGSALIGSTTNANAGRSRRYSFIFIDECFSIERFNEVWRSLQSVARLKVFVSTVKQGKVYQDFKKLCDDAGDYVSLKWSDHPFKDQVWYEEIIKKAEFDPEVMKEIVVDYALNIKSQYYPEIRKSVVSSDLVYNRGRPLYVSLDIGRSDLTVLIWWQYDGKNFNVLECYANRNKPVEWYAPFLNRDTQFNPEHYNEFQTDTLNRVRAWNKPVAFFGEEAHNHKVMPLNRSVVDEFYKYGVKIRWNPNAIKYEPRRHATAQLLPNTVFNGRSDYVMQLYDAIANSRYANSVVSKDGAMKPVHDNEIADFRSAAENFYVNITRVLRHQREEVDYQGAEKNAISSLIRMLKI